MRYTLLAAMMAATLAGTTRAAVLAWDDFDYIADGADITAVNFPRDRGFAKWVKFTGRNDFTATASGAISGTISGVITDISPTQYFAQALVDTDSPALSPQAGLTTWVGAKLLADQVPAEGLRLSIKIGTSPGIGNHAGLTWFPPNIWRAHDGTVATGTVEHIPVANKVFDVLFEIRQADYDVEINGETVLTGIALGAPNTGSNFVANIAFVTGDLAANGTTTVIVDDVAVYNADPRIGSETPGTDFRVVQDLQPNSRIDDGFKDGDDVIWTSMNGGFTAYRPDGSVKKGVLDIVSVNQIEAQNPIDFATAGGGADQIGYFAAPGNPGGDNDLEAKTSEYPAGLTSNFGYAGVPKILTAGVRVEGGIPRPVMFAAAGSNISRYFMDVQGYAGASPTGAATAGIVDLGYNDATDTIYWATAAGNLYAGSVATGTSGLIATDARIDAGTKINGGSWNGNQGVLVSYNDGTWEIYNNTGGSIATGNFAYSSGNPLDVAFGTDRIYYLVDVGGVSTDLYTLSPPPPGVPCATIEAAVLDLACTEFAAHPPTSLEAAIAVVTSIYNTVSGNLGGASDATEAECLQQILDGVLP